MMSLLILKRQKKLSRPNKRNLTIFKLDTISCRTKLWSLRNRLVIVAIPGTLYSSPPQQTAPSEDFISKSPYYVLLLSHASKLEFDVKRGGKKLSDMTTELEVLRKERQELEVVFTVRAKTIIVLAFGILMECTDFQGTRVY